MSEPTVKALDLRGTTWRRGHLETVCPSLPSSEPVCLHNCSQLHLYVFFLRSALKVIFIRCRLCGFSLPAGDKQPSGPQVAARCPSGPSPSEWNFPHGWISSAAARASSPFTQRPVAQTWVSAAAAGTVGGGIFNPANDADTCRSARSHDITESREPIAH